MRLRPENNTKLLLPMRHFYLPRVGISPQACISGVEDHSSLGSLSCLNDLSYASLALGISQAGKEKTLSFFFLLSIVLSTPARSRFLSHVYT